MKNLKKFMFIMAIVLYSNVIASSRYLLDKDMLDEYEAIELNIEDKFIGNWPISLTIDSNKTIKILGIDLRGKYAKSDEYWNGVICGIKSILMDNGYKIDENTELDLSGCKKTHK